MRSALCIGINDYPGTGSDLAGCVNDAQDWAQLLTDRRFSVSLMLDAEATRSEMIRAMTSIVTAAESDDTAVITYSGHGTWQPDDDGDEPDMRDEALCPHDLAESGALLDDDLFEIFAQRARGARVVFLSDSCHSGSVARIGPPLGAQERGRIRYLPPATFLGEGQVARARTVEKAPTRGLSRGTALLISGCADTEYSYDANFGGRPNGAFTRIALDTLSKLDPDATYTEWHAAIRAALPSADYPQTPQLSASRHQRRWRVLD
ncbi:MAG: caspase family protein [Pseudonocardiaceae bacterium]